MTPSPSKVVVRAGKHWDDRRFVIERRAGELRIVENAALKEQLYATGRRPAGHDHPTDAGLPPVVVLDVHGTLTPSRGFTSPGLPGAMLPPFPGVKEGLETLAAGGACLHIATAALSPYHPPLVLAARQMLVEAYCQQYGLPVSFITGKVPAHVYYDDRMVPVVDGDWDAVMDRVVQKLDKRFEKGGDGIWLRRDIPDTGHPYEFPPPEAIPPDHPRGYSVPVVDIDLHRCLFEASSSKLKDDLKPGALEALRTLYPLYTVHLSCAGWDPATHDPDESQQRAAGLRQQLYEASVPWDEMVSKDHPDVGVDDKGIEHTNWEDDLPLLLKALATPHPEDEVTMAWEAAAP